MKVKRAEKRRREIKDEHIEATGKRVFLVEGESDAFGLMPERKFGVEYKRKGPVAPAGGKGLVIAILFRFTRT